MGLCISKNKEKEPSLPSKVIDFFEKKIINVDVFDVKKLLNARLFRNCEIFCQKN